MDYRQNYLQAFGRRVKSARESIGLSQQDLADKVFTSKSMISSYENGLSDPRQSMIPLLSEALNVSIGWLMTGDDSTLDYSSYGLLPVTKRKIPVLGNVHCGTPKYAEQEYMDLVDTDINADFALIAKGDSMADVGIQDKDLVFVRRKPIVDNGKIAVVLIDEEAAIKRVHKTGDTLILSPANQNYEPLIFDSSSKEDIKILGEVVAYTHYFTKQNSEEE